MINFTNPMDILPLMDGFGGKRIFFDKTNRVIFHFGPAKPLFSQILLAVNIFKTFGQMFQKQPINGRGKPPYTGKALFQKWTIRYSRSAFSASV